MTLHPVNSVVGVGVGGSIVAKQLSEARLSVVLLEFGDWIAFCRRQNATLNSRILGLADGKYNDREKQK